MKIGRLHIPNRLIALDTIGSVLVVLGLLDWLADWQILPAAWIGESSGRTLTAIGAACMIMALLQYIRIMRSVSEDEEQDGL